jgi:hypothetical protein
MTLLELKFANQIPLSDIDRAFAGCCPRCRSSAYADHLPGFTMANASSLSFLSKLFRSAKALQSQSIVAWHAVRRKHGDPEPAHARRPAQDQRRVQVHTVREGSKRQEKKSGRCMAISPAPCSCGSISSTTSQDESTQSSPSCRSVIPCQHRTQHQDTLLRIITRALSSV